jgi:hypothetical protein
VEHEARRLPVCSLPVGHRRRARGLPDDAIGVLAPAAGALWVLKVLAQHPRWRTVDGDNPRAAGVVRGVPAACAPAKRRDSSGASAPQPPV